MLKFHTDDEIRQKPSSLGNLATHNQLSHKTAGEQRLFGRGRVLTQFGAVREICYLSARYLS